MTCSHLHWPICWPTDWNWQKVVSSAEHFIDWHVSR